MSVSPSESRKQERTANYLGETKFLTVAATPFEFSDRCDTRKPGPDFAPLECADRLILSSQLRLLAVRCERGIPLDIRSINNLLRAFRAVLSAELSA